jgi:hypothetical protein
MKGTLSRPSKPLRFLTWVPFDVAADGGLLVRIDRGVREHGIKGCA